MAYDRIFSIRMTEEQYKLAMEKAQVNGLSITELVRKLLADEKDVPTLKQLRIDIDRLRQDISYLQYSMELLMAAETEHFEYLLLRIPSRELPGANNAEKKESLKKLQEEAGKIADDCMKRALAQLIRFRGDESEADDPLHTSEFEKALLRKREENGTGDVKP